MSLMVHLAQTNSIGILLPVLSEFTVAGAMLAIGVLMFRAFSQHNQQQRQRDADHYAQMRELDRQLVDQLREDHKQHTSTMHETAMVLKAVTEDLKIVSERVRMNS